MLNCFEINARSYLFFGGFWLRLAFAGFTNPAGCNLITVATRNGKTLVGVVTGSSRGVHRDKKMVNLLDEHFGVKKETLKTKKASKAKIKIASNKAR